MNIFDQYSDRQIVEGLLINDKKIIQYFFYKKCSSMLSYVVYSVFGNKINKSELINELFLYLADKDWVKLRQFDYRSKLMTWITVVSVRFFQKKRNILIEKSRTEPLNEKMCKDNNAGRINSKIDINASIEKIKNERYRNVIVELDLNDVSPEMLAKKMNVSVDNLYNIHRRALIQLRLIMGRKEDWYD